MKKTIITLLALAGVAIGESTTTPKWTITNNGDGTATYTATLEGEYNINLGEAAIKNGESFILTIETSATGWANAYGSGLAGTTNPFDAESKKYDDAFTVYIGASPGNKKLIYALNDWVYTKTETDGVDYTGVPASINAVTPLTLGFTFTYVNSTDAGLPEGANESTTSGNYFTISNSANSDVTFDFIDYNICASFNFDKLINYGVTGGKDGGSTSSMPNAITTISITKAYTIPEPTTATLSLLALAGLAARRRRK